LEREDSKEKGEDGVFHYLKDECGRRGFKGKKRTWRVVYFPA
jgi:hypothetical protein